jgi:hypothetical protein
MHPFKQKMLRQEEDKREKAAIAHEAERTRRRALAKEERTGGGLAGMQARAQERAAAFESKQKASAGSVGVRCLWLFGCALAAALKPAAPFDCFKQMAAALSTTATHTLARMTAVARFATSPLDGCIAQLAGN